MTLEEKLKGIFTDQDKSESMMAGICNYNPDHTHEKTVWNRDKKRIEKTGEIVSSPIDCGYAKELQAINVSYNLIKQFGGEDQGSDYYGVWEFTDGDTTCYFKFHGFYQSFSGADFHSVFEVRPKQKTITVWE